MASNEVTEIISDLLNQSSDASDAIQRVIHSCSSATISKPDPGKLFLTNEDKYLNLMTGAMEYAIFPHAARPAFSAFVGITTRDSAWNWVVHLVRSNVADEDWAHAPNLGKLAHAFSKMSFTMSRCKFPIYLTRDKADAWFDMWRIINEPRMGFRGILEIRGHSWDCASIPYLPPCKCSALWQSAISTAFVPVICVL